MDTQEMEDKGQRAQGAELGLTASGRAVPEKATQRRKRVLPFTGTQKTPSWRVFKGNGVLLLQESPQDCAKTRKWRKTGCRDILKLQQLQRWELVTSQTSE